MMLYRTSVISLLIGASSLMLNCGKTHRAGSANSAMVPPAPGESEPDPLWNVSMDVLRRHGFRLDRVDRRAGIITTWPEESQHFFEFWRRDVATFRDRLEATVNPIRRWVEVQFRPGNADSAESFDVIVHKERMSSPDRQFNSSGAAYQFFGDTLPSTTGAIQVTAEDARWQNMGRDSAMEKRIADRIQEAAFQTNTGP